MIVSPNAADRRDSPPPGRRHDRALLVTSVLACLAWLPIQRWYALPDNRDRTHFAFEMVPGRFDSPILRGTLLLFVLIGLLHALGWWLLQRQGPMPSRTAKAAVLLAAAGPAVANLLLYPVGALDVFDYLVEMKLTWFYGQNPYLTTFADHRADPFALPAFLLNVPLFYGPAWLAASAVPALAAGFSDVTRLLVAVKVVNLLLVWAVAAILFRHHGGGRAGWSAAYLFAASPLVLFEGVGNAHNDVLMTAFLVAALVAASSRSALAGPALALSALVKFFTGALAPLFLAAAVRERWGWRIATTTLLATAVAVAVTAPWWADGQLVGGLAEGTAMSQKMDHVSPLSLAQQWSRRHPLPSVLAVASVAAATDCDSPFADEPVVLPAVGARCAPVWLSPSERADIVRGVCAALFALLALGLTVAVLRGRPLTDAAVDAMLLFALLMTNLYPWYLVPVVAVVALRPRRATLAWLFVATALGLAYYPAYVWARFNAGFDEWHRHLFLALFLTVPILALLAWEFAAPAVRSARRRLAAG